MSYDDFGDREATRENVEAPRSVPAVLTDKQQQELARAASEAMANLSLIIPPVLDQFRLLAQTVLPALAAAVKPFAEKMKELDLKPGQLEGLALAEEMDEGLDCLRCNPPRRVAPGYMNRHLHEIHGKMYVKRPEREDG